LVCARGICAVVQQARGYLRPALVGVVMLACAANAYWLVFAAYQTSLRHQPQRYGEQLTDYLRGHSQHRYYLSPAVREALQQQAGSAHELPVTDSAGEADYIVFYGKQWFGDVYKRPANMPNFSTTWFGPYEVNYDYYPDWDGDDRIVVISKAEAQRYRVVENLVDPSRGRSVSE